MKHYDLISSKSLYDKGAYVESAEKLRAFIEQTSGWDGVRYYLSEDELKALGFQSLNALEAFEHNVFIKGFNVQIKEAVAIAAENNSQNTLDYMHDAICDAGINIERTDLATLSRVLENTGLETADDVYSIFYNARDQLIAPKLEAFWKHIKSHDYSQAQASLDATIEPIFKAQPNKARIGKDRYLPELAKSAFAARQGIAVQDIDSAIRDMNIFLSMSNVVDNYDNARCKLTKINEIIGEYGFDQYEDLPNHLKEALDKILSGGFQKEMMRIRMSADIAPVLYGNDPNDSTSFLRDIHLIKDFVKANDKASIFEIPLEEVVGKRESYILPEWREAYKGLMVSYRHYLDKKDDPDYSALHVREDYYKAVSEGANLKMESMADRLNYCKYKIGHILGVSAPM